MSTKECPTYGTILCKFEPNLMTCPEAKLQWITKIFWIMAVLQLILDNRIKGENKKNYLEPIGDRLRRLGKARQENSKIGPKAKWRNT